MAEIIWTDAAIKAIDAIATYIGRNSMRYAQLTVKQLFDRTKRLETQPYIGHIVPEINDPSIREIH